MAYVVVVALLFGVIAALLAHHKARNALGWFIVGCLLGPFSLAVWLLPMALKDGVTRVCPRCSETIRLEAKVCRHCSSDLRGITPA